MRQTVSDRLLPAVLGVVMIGCAQTVPGDPTPGTDQFGTPLRVTILGYDGDAMEPFLSRDGEYLFFNSLNDPAVNTDLHWAERVDDSTFQYKREISGINTSALEAVASMDRDGIFYFVSTRSYVQTASTLYRGRFANGVVSQIELVPGVSAAMPGVVQFDAEIAADGKTLCFVESQFGPGGPQTADIVIAAQGEGGFRRSAASASLLGTVNTRALEYAPALSASGLELLFTRLEGDSPVIYLATRGTTGEPFGPARRVLAATGFVEAATWSPDERAFFFHKRERNRFVLYRVTRP